MIAWFIGTSTGRNVLAIGAALLALLAVIGGLMRAGAKNERARTRERTQRETIKAHEVRNEVERTVDRGGNIRERLHRNWTRP